MANSTHPTAQAQDEPSRLRRRRLTPDARVPLILDAALHEFSAQGYKATRIDDIARRAGLSKSGFYAHFSSKDEVFEALLKRSMQIPVLDVAALLNQADTADTLVGQLLAPLYEMLSHPEAVATARLLIAESHRLPEAVARWRYDTMNSLAGQISQLLQQAVARGLCRDSSLRANPWLVLAPIVYTVVQQATEAQPLGAKPPDEGTQLQPGSFADARQAQAALLCELLTPRAPKT
ncbi:TetR/AcrR family transcriptional regulator [Roseateles koreensis]|nr:TetR/AcrR family transcriptional regulator [Roseateles koreensis]